MSSALRQLPLFVTERRFKDRPVTAVTFKGGIEAPIHRWFRLTPSFAPELVEDILRHWAVPPGARILEPFCGAGTTPVVCQALGLNCDAVELNPLLHFVSTVKVTPLHEPERLLLAAAAVLHRAEQLLLEVQSLDAEPFLHQWRAVIPGIHDVLRWWSLPVLKKIVVLRQALAESAEPQEIKDFLRLAVVSFLIEVSNAAYNHPSLSFASAAKPDAPVWERFQAQVALMAADLRAFPTSRSAARIWRGNAKDLARVLPPGSRFEAVLTSPPYPNRYSYARETRPQMFYLGLVADGREVGELETQAIGGTWGKATSVLAQPVPYRSAAVHEALGTIPEQIGQHSPLMRNYVVKYFNDMETHLESLLPLLRPRAPLAYVIGNSRFYGIELPADEILGRLFVHHGCRLNATEKMRLRNCKPGLYEAILFLEAPA